MNHDIRQNLIDYYTLLLNRDLKPSEIKVIDECSQKIQEKIDAKTIRNRSEV
jgi:hypothetical protein